MGLCFRLFVFLVTAAFALEKTASFRGSVHVQRVKIQGMATMLAAIWCTNFPPPSSPMPSITVIQPGTMAKEQLPSWSVRFGCQTISKDSKDQRSIAVVGYVSSFHIWGIVSLGLATPSHTRNTPKSASFWSESQFLERRRCANGEPLRCVAELPGGACPGEPTGKGDCHLPDVLHNVFRSVTRIILY